MGLIDKRLLTMNTIKVLIEGYAKENGTFNASSSTVLIESNGKKILVDPGCNKELLLEALKKENLTVDDIDIVFLTHYHPDHILNIRLFPNHDIYDGDTIYRDDLEIEYDNTYIPGTDIKILETPGHAHEQCSLVVKVNHEIYVVAEDVFWWMDGEQKDLTRNELIDMEDPYMESMRDLKKSRKTVLDAADWIIPGHGKMFMKPKI